MPETTDNRQTQAPIALIIFNRPEETARVFEVIRQAKPERLFIIADGPRNDSERTLTQAARAVVEHIDWPCNVEKNYAEKNLGCRERILSGLNWVFDHAERAIILEDDCLPDPTFFRFCDELLEHYKNDEQVMTIGGVNLFQKQLGEIQESYFATVLPQTTGWATWRRAWQQFDPDMKEWPALRDSRALEPIIDNPAAYEREARIWDDYYVHHPDVADSWDGAWAFATIARKAVCLNPKVNLISNIGFNERATHSKDDHPQANLPTYPMPFPLVHPKGLVANRKADALFFRYSMGIDLQWRYRLVRPIKTYFPHLYQQLKKVFGKQ